MKEVLPCQTEIIAMFQEWNCRCWWHTVHSVYITNLCLLHLVNRSAMAAGTLQQSAFLFPTLQAHFCIYKGIISGKKLENPPRSCTIWELSFAFSVAVEVEKCCDSLPVSTGHRFLGFIWLWLGWQTCTDFCETLANDVCQNYWELVLVDLNCSL